MESTTQIKDVGPVRSINWHITSRCNYACKFCFARDRGAEIRDLSKITSVLSELRERGIEKLNLAGGEPLLHPLFCDILRAAKDLGFVTSIVTNGSLIDRGVLEKCRGNLDWVGVSVDSSSDLVEKELGRGVGGHVAHAVQLARDVHDLGIKLKVNTVVTKLNYQEEMGPFIEKLAPHRWKVFQCLHMFGCNDDHWQELEVTREQFSLFIQNNANTTLRGGVKPVFERSEDMLGSYLMLSPDGQLTLDAEQIYRKVGWDAFAHGSVDAFVDPSKYQQRGGEYTW